MMEELKAVLEKMKADCFTGDPEIDHNNADYALMDALRAMSTNDENKAMVEEIIATWESVSKWYA